MRDGNSFFLFSDGVMEWWSYGVGVETRRLHQRE